MKNWKRFLVASSIALTIWAIISSQIIRGIFPAIVYWCIASPIIYAVSKTRVPRELIEIAKETDIIKKLELTVAYASIKDKYSSSSVPGWMGKFRKVFSCYSIGGDNAYDVIICMASNGSGYDEVKKIVRAFDKAKGHLSEHKMNVILSKLATEWNLFRFKSRLETPVWGAEMDEVLGINDIDESIKKEIEEEKKRDDKVINKENINTIETETELNYSSVDSGHIRQKQNTEKIAGITDIQQVRYCRKCGNKIPIDSTFCPYCGENIGKAHHREANYEKTHRTKKSGFALVFIIILAIACVGGTTFVAKLYLEERQELEKLIEKADDLNTNVTDNNQVYIEDAEWVYINMYSVKDVYHIDVQCPDLKMNHYVRSKDEILQTNSQPCTKCVKNRSL